MTTKRMQEIDDIVLDIWRIKRKLAEILKEEDEYADSLDENDDDEYFKRKFAKDTVEILKAAIEYCGKASDKMEEAKG